MSIYAPSEERFQSLLRISRASIATPSWFAAPVEAEENEKQAATESLERESDLVTG